MPSTNWSKLSPLQLGRYAEYYAKMEFASYGFEVYTSEVDDHGVDFIAKNPHNNQFYEVQVKSIRNTGYVFVQKDKIEIQGRGGTDFRPVFRYVDQLRREGQLKELGALIYFTDGDGVYPEESPEFDTAFVFLKDTDSLKMVPSWAYVLKVWT